MVFLISIHAARREPRRERTVYTNVAQQFQSTRLAGSRDLRAVAYDGMPGDFNPRGSQGAATKSLSPCAYNAHYFNPRGSQGAATSQARPLSASCHISIHAARREPRQCKHKISCQLYGISIHAARREPRQTSAKRFTRLSQFQSTRLAGSRDHIRSA